MGLYQKIPAVVEATQWFENGDHPHDRVGELIAPEGEPPYERLEGVVVRFFRSPEQDHAGFLIHEVCGRSWHDHGWIDRGADGRNVCPGDWVITDNGVYHRCDPDNFALNYEPA